MHRKVYKITSLLIGMLAFVLASCSNILTGTTSLDDTSERIKKCILNMNISNYETLGNDNLVKTILPNDWSDSDKASFTYEISGRSSQGETFSQSITFTSGTAQLALSYSIWELTLTAKKNDVAVLQGHTFADLTNGGTTVSFRLVSGTLNTVGEVNLGGTYTDTDSVVRKYTMGLYKFDTGEKVSADGEVDSSSDDISAKTFSYTKADVAPGTYIFAIKFYREREGGVLQQCGYWSDMVIVAAGNTTQKTDIAIPDIIQKKPAAPQNLKVYLKDGSETTEGFYTVRLEWEDKSINEENFIVTVSEYTALDDDSPSVFKILGVKEDLENKKEVFWGSDSRIDGTLLSGSSNCELRLPTGRLFDITIAAQNFAGISSECTRVASTTKTDYTGYAIAGNMRINRVRMSYVLDGGTLTKETEGGSTTVHNGTYVEYNTYTGSSFKVFGYTSALTYPLRTNSESLTGYPRLLKDNHPFQKWLITGTETEATENDGFKNLDVTADYKLTYTIDFTIPGYSDMEAGRVTITYNDGSGDVDCVNGIVLAGAEASNPNPPVTFTVVAPTSGQMEFDLYEIRMDGAVIYSGESNTYSLPNVTNRTSGGHIVNVFAKKKNTTEWYSFTCQITISR